jgi:hypothetical protein
MVFRLPFRSTLGPKSRPRDFFNTIDPKRVAIKRLALAMPRTPLAGDGSAIDRHHLTHHEPHTIMR